MNGEIYIKSNIINHIIISKIKKLFNRFLIYYEFNYIILGYQIVKDLLFYLYALFQS